MYKCQDLNSNWLKCKKDMTGSQNCQVQWYICLQTLQESSFNRGLPDPGSPSLHSTSLLHPGSLHKYTPRTPGFHPTSSATLEAKRGLAHMSFSTKPGTNSDWPIWGHMITRKIGRKVWLKPITWHGSPDPQRKSQQYPFVEGTCKLGQQK